MSEPPTSASLPHPDTISVVKPHGANGTVGRHTGRTVDGYVLAVNGVLNYAWERHSVQFQGHTIICEAFLLNRGILLYCE